MVKSQNEEAQRQENIKLDQLDGPYIDVTESFRNFKIGIIF